MAERGNTGTEVPSSLTIEHMDVIGKIVLETIRSRRSLRECFTGEPVLPEIIEEIIQSGLTAPSSKNAQPWRIHVLQQGDRLHQIADMVQMAKNAQGYVPIDPATGKKRPELGSTVAESAQVLRDVGVGLFIENKGAFSGGRKVLLQSAIESKNPTPGMGFVGYSLEMLGLGAMIENMWLSAHALGLGGVFMGDILVAEDEVNAELGIEGDLVGVLALGYTAMQPRPKILRPDSVVYHDPEREG